jgi:hypothetical protein
MAASDIAGPSPASRKIRRLGITVAVIVALYSAGWFFVASKIETYLDGMVNHTGPGGLNVQCDKPTTTGFPFLIGFSCDRTAISDKSRGNTLTAGALNVAARIYNPGTAVVELKGPANVALENGGTIEGQWDQLRASFRANFSGLSTFSSDGKALSIKVSSPELVDTLTFAAKDGQLHLRNNSGDLDAAVSAANFSLTDSSNTPLLPLLSTSVELTLAGKGALLEGVPFGSKAMKGKLTSFKIETSDGIYGEMSGPFTVDDEGYISGTFKTKLEKLDLWENRLRGIFPEAGDTISAVAILLKGLAKGKDEVTVKLKVNDGDISLSLLPLGKIPPI